MRRLARRRSLVILIVLAVGLAAFGLPGHAAAWDDCSGPADQHCSPVVLSALQPPVLLLIGLVEAHQTPSPPPAVVASILKIPLPA